MSGFLPTLFFHDEEPFDLSVFNLFWSLMVISASSIWVTRDLGSTKVRSNSLNLAQMSSVQLKGWDLHKNARMTSDLSRSHTMSATLWSWWIKSSADRSCCWQAPNLSLCLILKSEGKILWKNLIELSAHYSGVPFAQRIDRPFRWDTSLLASLTEVAHLYPVSNLPTPLLKGSNLDFSGILEGRNVL